MSREATRRRDIRRAILAGLAAVLAAATAVALLRPASSASTSPTPVIAPDARKPAPPLTSAVLVPPPLSMARYRGRVLLVNFWASWCHPCRREAPQLAAFARQLNPRRAALVGVNVNDNRRDARRFLARYGLDEPNGVDRGEQLVHRYRVPGLPTTVVIDRRGRIAARLLGPQTVASLHAVLSEVAR